MKKIFAFVLLLVSPGLFAQENNQQLYLKMEFMQVKDHNDSDYHEVEEFWTKIHQQRVADNNIVGWDLWQMSPAGKEQGSQYFTVTLFTSLAGMLEEIPEGKFEEYFKGAYPNMSQEDQDQMMEKTVQSRDIAHEVYCKLVNQTSGGADMQLGTIIVFDIMKQLHDSYEKVEAEVFKPWHQEMVDKGNKESWGLMQILLPAGSDAKGTHLTYSMFSSYEQLAGSIENSGGDMDMTTSLAVQKGLKTRDMVGVEMAKLIKMVR